MVLAATWTDNPASARRTAPRLDDDGGAPGVILGKEVYRQTGKENG